MRDDSSSTAAAASTSSLAMHRQRGGDNQRRMGAAEAADAAAAASQPEGRACMRGRGGMLEGERIYCGIQLEAQWREELRKAMKVALVPNCGCNLSETL
jgi:hypothetical protein